MEKRKYPVGMQNFADIRRRGFVYVDKTDLVYTLQDECKYVFLSRPRRFGKSLLSSTLHSFFDGDRALFEGLKIMELEQEWTKYPVLHLDISTAKNEETAAGLQSALMYQLRDYCDEYGYRDDEDTPGKMMRGIIKRAFNQTGRQVVIIIDEYDAPLLDSLKDDDEMRAKRRVMQDLYTPLKASDQYIRFAFITGITKFSQMSIFSSINNLLNISMVPKYAAICGITETELTTTLWPDIELLAEAHQCSPEEMHQRLKTMYDGYHFTEDSEEVYNPYSLMTAFSTQKINSIWFASGTPTFLIYQMQRFGTDITNLENLTARATDFDLPFDAMKDALPLLYQTGYLTIKDYDPVAMTYQLTMPNHEVRVGLLSGLLPAYIGLTSREVDTGFAYKIYMALRKGEPEQAMQVLQSYMASIPYIDGFKKKLADAASKEAFYEYTMYLILSSLNSYVRTQVRCAGGRADMVILMPDATYVFELKVCGTAAEALQQIDSKDYALPYKADGKRIVKIGVKFNPDTRVPEEWIVAEE